MPIYFLSIFFEVLNCFIRELSRKLAFLPPTLPTNSFYYYAWCYHYYTANCKYNDDDEGSRYSWYRINFQVIRQPPIPVGLSTSNHHHTPRTAYTWLLLLLVATSTLGPNWFLTFSRFFTLQFSKMNNILFCRTGA